MFGVSERYVTEKVKGEMLQDSHIMSVMIRLCLTNVVARFFKLHITEKNGMLQYG